MDNHSTNLPARREAGLGSLRPPFAAPTEAALVRAMLPGAPDRERAWAEFYRRELPQLVGFIAHKLGRDRESEVEDVASELVIKIELNLERFEHRKEGSFRAWCLQIAQNLCLSRHRRRKGEPAPRELLSFEQLEEQLVAQEIGDGWDGLDSADQPKRLKSEREVAMQEAFATLNAVDQAVIEMKYITPTPDKQIAAIVQKPESQIPQIRYKANKKLRRAFERAVAGRLRKT